jgi:hypothetical protein
LLFKHSVVHLIKSACTSLLIKTLCQSRPKLPLLGLLITFVKNFQFNFFNVCVFCKSIFSNKLDLKQETHVTGSRGKCYEQCTAVSYGHSKHNLQ